MQSVQEVCPAGEKVPAEHVLAGDWSPAQDLPTGHCEQVLPVL
jgi:hypothetical protein